MKNQKFDFKSYNLQILTNDELETVIGGTWKQFFSGLLQTAIGAGEMIAGAGLYIIDKGRLFNEGENDVIDGGNQMAASLS
jgi:hypothetical protein